MADAAPTDRRKDSSHSSVEEGENKGLTHPEKATRVGSSSVEEAREEEQGHMATALKGLTHAMSALAESKFGFDPSSDEEGGDSPTPLPPSESMQQKNKAHTSRMEQWLEEPAEFPSRPPVEPVMLYARSLLPRDSARKKKKAPVAVQQPSTLAPAALDASKEEKKTQVVIEPSTPDILEERMEAYWAKRKKEMETEAEITDMNAHEARLYRKFWLDAYAVEECASYEDTTSIPPMCFTDKACTFISMQPTLQVYSVKIEEVTNGLSWPLDVYGVVAVRDVVDHKRNVIFYRERDNCQTISPKEPFLALTGPTRAVVVTVHPTYFEADLKVKGDTESEDKDFSLLAVSYVSNGPSTSCLLTRSATSMLSTLRFNFANIVNSVEATVSIEMLGGAWPDEYHKGAITARTASVKGVSVSLLTFGDGQLPVEDGKVKLSRRVISVELVPNEEEKVTAKLLISLKAGHSNDKIGKVFHQLSFKPKSRGRSHRTIKVQSCEMQVSVAWSLLSTFRCSYEKVMSS